MATVYHELGSKVTIVELMDQIIPGADKDIVTPLMKRIQKKYENIHLKTKVTKVEATEDGLVAHFEGGKAPETDTFDRILVAVGRRPNGRTIGAENAGWRWTSAATSRWTSRCGPTWRTSSRSATWSPACSPTTRSTTAGWRSRRLRAKTASSTPRDPVVAYTDPEVAWVGPTEKS